MNDQPFLKLSMNPICSSRPAMIQGEGRRSHITTRRAVVLPPAKGVFLMRHGLASTTALAIVLGLTACGDDGGPSVEPDAGLEGFTEPEDVCPGSAHCMNGDGGRLFVGAAGRIFTPELPETFTDVDDNGEWS